MSKGSTPIKRIANFVAIVLNITKLDIIITLNGCYIGPCCNRCNLQIKFRKGLNDKKRKSTHYYGGRKKFCGDDDVIPDPVEIDELDLSEFDMNEDNFMLLVFVTT